MAAAKKPRKSTRARAADVGADGIRLFTRGQAARYLGVSLHAVKAAEAKGQLTAAVVRGVSVFARSELDRYRSGTQRGRAAARAFGLLRAGHTPAQVVEELELDPETVSEFVGRYCEWEGALLVSAPTGARAAWERAFGVRLSPPLVLRAVELVARHRELRDRLVRGAT